MRIKLRFLLAGAMAWLTTAAVLPAAATTYKFQIGGEKLVGAYDSYFATLTEAKNHVLANGGTYTGDDTVELHIYSDQIDPMGNWGVYVKYIGEKNADGVKPTLRGGGSKTQSAATLNGIKLTSSSTVTLSGRTYSSCKAQWEHVNGIFNCNFIDITSNGDCLFTENDGEGLSCENSTFVNCTTKHGIFDDDYGDYEGKRYTSVKYCTFENCHASDNGGVFYDCTYPRVFNCKFVNCKSDKHGGVFYQCKDIEAADCTFSGCEAGDGGVLWAEDETEPRRFIRCRFLNCKATDDDGEGGAIYCHAKSHQIYVTDSVFSGCEAGKKGGAVYDGKSDATYCICNCTFYNCNHTTVYHMNCYNCLFYDTASCEFDDCPNSNNQTLYSSTYPSIFVDTVDFKLLRNEATRTLLIDKGNNNSRPSWGTELISDTAHDLNGNARTVNGTVDIGCTEWAPSEDGIVVTSGGDSGDGTLRDAINQINTAGKGVISFSVSAVTLTSALPTLTASDGVTINGDSGIQINCNFTGRALTMDGNGAYSLTGLHFNGGGKASAILNNSATSLTVTDCSFVNLKVEQLGGAGIRSCCGDLTVENCRFDDCEPTLSTCGGGIVYSGAGVVSISKCSFVGCGIGGNGAAIAFHTYSGGGIEIQNCSFLENKGRDDIFFYDSKLPSVSIVAQCTFVGIDDTEFVRHAGTSKGKLCLASCLFANCPKVAFGESASTVLIDVKRSLFSACVPEGCTYSTDTSFTGDGCYIVSSNEQEYVLGEKIESTVSGVTQTSYTLGEHSPAMEFPGWLIWRNGWSGVGYQRAKDVSLGKGTLLGNSGSDNLYVVDLFGQNYTNGFDQISVTCDAESSIAPPVGAIWNTPDDYEELARVMLVDLYNHTTNTIAGVAGDTTTAPTPPPTRPRATFNGWWTKEYCKGDQWFDEQCQQVITPLESGTLLLYAGWKGTDKIRFVNLFSSEVTAIGVINGDPLPTVDEGVPVPKHTGHTFVGWNDGDYWGHGVNWYDADGNVVKDPPVYPNVGDTYLFSRWEGDIKIDPPIVVTGTTNISNRTLAHHATNELFRVESGGKLQLNSVTITGDTWCVLQRRSAILNNGGTVICSNCNFTSLLVPTNSGAVYSGTGGSSRFINCSFTENTARKGGAVQSSGGTLCFLNCTFTGNNTPLGGTENPGGAAIATTGAVNLQLGACTVTDNTAPSTNYGAGVWLDNAAGAEVRLFSTIIQGNGAKNEMTVTVSGGKWASIGHGSYIGDQYVGEDVLRNYSKTYPSAAVTMLGSMRTMVCDGVTQTYFPPLNEARKKGMKVWIKEGQLDWGGNSPGAGWSEVTWDILGEQTVSGKSISLRDSYVGSRRRNVLQDLIDATPTSGEWYSDMTLTVPKGTYDPVDITRPIRIVGENGAEIEAAYLQSCVTISNSPSPVVVGGMTFTDGGGAQGGGVKVTDGGEITVVSNCTFNACAVTDKGGGIYDEAQKALAVSDTFTSCTAANGGGVYGVGTVQDCTFKKCVATAEGGGVGGATLVASSTFTLNAATEGGGAYGVGELLACTLTGNIATNAGGGASQVTSARACTFKANVARHGGGLNAAYAKECVFEKNLAGSSAEDADAAIGGGANETDAMGCIFRENRSYGTGGGLAARDGGNARGCLFIGNRADGEGGAIVGNAYNCTFVRNTGDGSRNLATSVQNANGYCYDSLCYNNALPTHPDSVSRVAKSSHFYDTGADNYHLSDTEDVVEDLVGSSAGRMRARDGGWTDPENSDLVNTLNGESYYYLGCYAYLPREAAGVIVNGTEDTYEDTNVKTSLREAIENARQYPLLYASADGKIHIQFDEHKLFRDGALTEVTLNFEKSGVAIADLKGCPLVIEAPADRGITITAADTYRPFYVLPGNRLELNGITISGTAGGPYSMGGYMAGTDGGAVLNGGTLIASNCAFRACLGGRKAGSAVDPPVGRGGAICGMSGSTTVVQRCTFDGCRASCGGAIYQTADSFATYVGTTFSGNRAQSGGTVLSGTGGAVHLEDGADAAFVNCTLAGNVADDSGAGVYAEGSTSLLDTLVIGNRRGETAEDLTAYGAVKMVRCWYGVFPNGATHLTATESEGGKSPADVFAKIASDGWAIATTQNVDHVPHTVYTLRKDGETDGYYAWSDALGVNIGYDKSSSRPNGTLRGSAQAARRGTLIVRDQLGNPADDGKALPMGAVNRKETSSQQLPETTVDPLCVTADNTLEKAFAYAQAATPKNGYVTITFDPSVTSVAISQVLTLENFTAANGKTLRIVGGDDVTINGDDHRAFLVKDGNRLELTNLTITASHQGSGGAIRVERGSLVAERITFKDCKTRSGNTTEFSDGGAVALIGDCSSATFTDCAFTDCEVDAGYGKAVYRETEDIRFYRCTFGHGDGAYEEEDDIDSPMRVRVEHPDGTFDLFAETLPAFRSALKAGDVVRILDADAQDVADLKVSIPLGVTVVDETDGSAATLMAAVKVAMAASIAEKDWYSVVATASSVGVQLNEEAIPELTGEGAEIDLDGSADEVSVMPANVKPGLWYGLGHSETPEGPYTVETWVQADANGNLPSSLTAPKGETGGFYRVVVKE